MNFKTKLKADFRPPEHGWTIVELSAGDDSYRFVPSFVPYDSFGELIYALLDMLDGLPKAVVRWNDEPVEHKFVFTSDGKQVVFKVYEIIDSVIAGKVDHEKFSFCGSFYEVVRPFWKGLREMQSHQSLEEYEKHWRLFPQSGMLELTQKIKSLKNSSF